MSNQKIINNISVGKTIDNYNINKFFENYVLQKEYYPYQFDGWKEKQLYGLTNNSGKAIFPKASVLTLNSNDNGVNYTNLIFVTDAFQDMKAYHASYLLNNKFSNNGSLYVTLDIKSATNNFDTIYINYLNRLFNIFSSIFITAEKAIKIKDFTGFTKHFIDYAKIMSPYFPLTRSSFIKHKSCPISISGLTIDLADGVLYSDTVTKANKYISDPNFDIFLDSARRYGFYVDRNAPWRLVADLESPVMKDYCRRYNLSSTDQVFRDCYEIAYYTDLHAFKNVLISFWNTYIETNTLSSNQKEIKNCSALFAEINTYNQLNSDTFDKMYNKNWMIRLYLYTKVYENELKITQNIFEILYQEAIKLNEYAGENNMLDYIDRKMTELSTRGKRQKNMLTTPDEMVKMLSLQEPPSIAEGINF